MTPQAKNINGNPISDPFGQEIRDFVSNIARCHQEGVKETEASDEIIQYYNQNGLGEAKFFIFQSVCVYPMGKTAAIKAEMSEQMSKRLHGAKEGTVVGL